MKTRLATPARDTAREMNRWWRKKRLKAPKLFAQELQGVRRRIAEDPNLGQVYAVRPGGVVVRRILMAGTRTHVFYEVREAEGVVMILALWGAMKESGPDIGIE